MFSYYFSLIKSVREFRGFVLLVSKFLIYSISSKVYKISHLKNPFTILPILKLPSNSKGMSGSIVK